MINFTFHFSSEPDSIMVFHGGNPATPEQINKLLLVMNNKLFDVINKEMKTFETLAKKQILKLTETNCAFPANYASEANYHRHKCAFCGFVWEHHDINDKSHNAVPGLHECPSCYRCNRQLGIYDGPETPRIRNGAGTTEQIPLPNEALIKKV